MTQTGFEPPTSQTQGGRSSDYANGRDASKHRPALDFIFPYELKVELVRVLKNKKGYCHSLCLSLSVFLSLDMSEQYLCLDGCLSLDHVYRMTSRKWISDIILFTSSLLFYAESF